MGISKSNIQDCSPLLVEQVQHKLTWPNSSIPNDGKANGVPTPLQDCRETPDFRLIREVTLENNKKCSDEEGIDPQDLSRVWEGSSNRALPPNRRMLAVKPGSMHRNETRKVGSARFNHLLIFTTTWVRIILRSALESQHIQWEPLKLSAQATRQRKTANQRL